MKTETLKDAIYRLYPPNDVVREQYKSLVQSHSELQSIGIEILFYLQNCQKGSTGAKLHDKIVQQLEKAKQITI